MSRAAFVSDLAANDTLAALDAGWETASLQERHELLVGLRQFLDACPLCSATLVEETDAIESCCWTTNAITARCERCDARMYVVADE
jgi:FMN phosphatase YigB (HAD superfamily)